VTLLVISPDYASHALPLLTLAGAWREAGERVVVASGPAVAPLAVSAGCEHVELVMSRGSNGGIARPENQPPGEDRALAEFFAATRHGALATLLFQARSRGSDLLWQPELVARRTMELVEAYRPDAVVVDHLAFAATLGLRALGTRYADVVVGHPRQLPVAGETYGVPGDWPAALAPDRDGLDALQDEARQVTRAFTDEYNRVLRSLSAEAMPVQDAFAAHGDLVLFNYPRSLHHPRRARALPLRHAFLGSLVRRAKAAPEVARWLERAPGQQVVMVSLGTFLSARTDVMATIVAGLRQLDCRVAMAVGASSPAQLGPLPADWLVAPFLPQPSILERASLLVTHGGNNSVTEALSHGVPMLVLPFSTDQFDGAAALERAGLGLAADPNSLTAADVRAAAESLLAGPRAANRSLAVELVARPGPARARAAIGSLLPALGREGALAPVALGLGSEVVGASSMVEQLTVTSRAARRQLLPASQSRGSGL
jgi:zeaxanthin glucosyltransferase